MARYDKIYETLVKRAVNQSAIDIETFIERALESGISEEALEERLLNDLKTGGPIFGKFTRSLEGAAAGSVLSAESQGEDVARARYEELLSMSEMEDILDDADPETLDELSEELSDREVYTWICDLVNTCDHCLPLHGTSATKAEWDERNLNPESIHVDLGWDSPCHCVLLADSIVQGSREELIAPLVRERVKSTTGLEGSKRTQRAVAQKDIDRAIAAVEKARQTETGRRTLRLMGQVNDE